MIRKLSAFLILAFIGWGYLQAQEAKTCFKNMPDSICPLLSAVNRADFIDFLESKMKAEVTNRCSACIAFCASTGIRSWC